MDFRWFAEALITGLIALLAWFFRDKLKTITSDIAEVGDGLKEHKENCAHTTPREKQLFEELMHQRFTTIDQRFTTIDKSIESLGLRIK